MDVVLLVVYWPCDLRNESLVLLKRTLICVFVLRDISDHSPNTLPRIDTEFFSHPATILPIQHIPRQDFEGRAMCFEEYTIRRCRWCNTQFGNPYRTHDFPCMYCLHNDWSPRCYGTGGPVRECVEEWSVCSREYCYERHQEAVNRARGDAHRVARDRERELEEAARQRARACEDQRITAARQRHRERQDAQERRELARYRNGTLFSGYDEDEEFQIWLRAGHGWRSYGLRRR